MKLLFSLAISLATLCVSAQSQTYPKLDTLLQRLAENNKAMGALVITTPEGVAYQSGYGNANRAQEQLNTTQTRFRIGSISKTFTALIIMQLVEEGKLKLNDRLGDFFPDLPNAQAITVAQMLGHRSGLYNFTNAQQYLTYMEKPQSRADMLAIFKEGGTVFEPGEKMEYSNTNYVLLSFIAEEVEQQRFAAIFQKRIAQRLSLKNTYVETAASNQPKAESYEWDGAWQVATHTHPSVPLGAGAVVSTPLELNRAFRGIFNHKLCSQENLERMQEEQLGLFLFPFGGKVAYGHNGGIDGFVANASYFRKDSVAVTCLNNGLNYNLNQLMLGVLSIYFEQPYTLPNFGQAVKVDTALLKTYVGVYKSAQFPLDITLSVEGEQLKAQATGQPMLTLEAQSPTDFTFAPAGIEIEFSRAGQFTLRQNGQVVEFEREKP
jgi:CubicO group peptidase (beta-lactamase class C family)